MCAQRRARFDGKIEKLAPMKTFIGPNAVADAAADRLRTRLRVALTRLLVIERDGTPAQKGAPVPRAAGLCTAAVAAGVLTAGQRSPTRRVR